MLYKWKMGEDKSIEQKMFDSATKMYDVLINMCKDVYTNICVHLDNPKPLKTMLVEVDIYLQALMLGVASVDGEINTYEIQLIDKITDYGDLFRKIGIEAKSLTNSSKDLLIDVIQLSRLETQRIPEFFSLLAILDTPGEANDFGNLILKCVKHITDLMSAIDGQATRNEAEIFAKLLQPLMDKFPKINVRKFITENNVRV